MITSRKLLDNFSIILQKSKVLGNISKQEFISLKSLNNNQNIIVLLKADKGGVVVTMDRKDYDDKMLDHLSTSGNYKKLRKNLL